MCTASGFKQETHRGPWSNTVNVYKVKFVASVRDVATPGLVLSGSERGFFLSPHPVWPKERGEREQQHSLLSGDASLTGGYDPS